MIVVMMVRMDISGERMLWIMVWLRDGWDIRLTFSFLILLISGWML